MDLIIPSAYHIHPVATQRNADLAGKKARSGRSIDEADTSERAIAMVFFAARFAVCSPLRRPRARSLCRTTTYVYL